MELLQIYSNRGNELRQLTKLQNLPVAARPRRPAPAKRAQHRLGPRETAKLVAEYEAGERVGELARRYQVHRTTVTDIISRSGVPVRPTGLDPRDLPEAIRLYEASWSLARLGEHFGVTGHNTISDALRKAGVAIRPRRGR